MTEATIIGLDLAKNVFQAHGARADGSVAFRIKLVRTKVLAFFAAQPTCTVAMEACASAHYWARAIGELGHDVKLIPPIYVKPFAKRQKNGMADAEAIAEAASRPTMRFVAVKSEEKQAAGMAFRTRDLFVRQKTQTINALRGHLAEYGVVAPKGTGHLGWLIRAVEDPCSVLAQPVVALAQMLLDQIAALQVKITTLGQEIRMQVRRDDVTSRLMAIPGIGPICAAAMVVFAPPPETFAKGRDFAAWVGLTPSRE